MNVEKMAAKDAHDWARAEMFFGEGAGVRRRHLFAQIEARISQYADKGYEEAFNRAYSQQNMADHAIKAAKERQNIDRLAKANRNLRAVRTGNLQNLTTGAAILAGAYYVAHQTGYDKKIEREAKKLYKKARLEVKYRVARAQGRNVEKLY